MKYPQDILEYEQFTLMEIGVLTVMLLGDPTQVEKWANSLEYANVKKFLFEIGVLEVGDNNELSLNADRKCNFSILKLDELGNPVYIHKHDETAHIKKVLIGGDVKLLHRDSYYDTFDKLDKFLSVSDL